MPRLKEEFIKSLLYSIKVSNDLLNRKKINPDEYDMYVTGYLESVYIFGYGDGKREGFKNGLNAGQRETQVDIINKFRKFVESEND